MPTNTLPAASAPVTVGHPVDVATGAVYVAWHDFEFSGRSPVVWRRFYSTANGARSALGLGWTCEYFRHLEPRDGTLWMSGPEGHEHGFAPPAGSAAAEIIGHQWELRRAGDEYMLFDRRRAERLFFARDRSRTTERYSLRRIEDLSGNRITLAYDEWDRLTAIEQESLQRRFEIAYGDRRLIERILFTAPGWRPEVLVTYAHDDAGRLIASSDASGGVIRYDYDARDRLVREVNKVGGSYVFEYDAAGRCVRTVGDDGYMERRLEYDPNGRWTRVSDSDGHVTTYHLNRDGVVDKVTDPYGHVSQRLYAGGIEQHVNRLGAITQHEWDDRGQLVKRVDQLGRAFEFAYDALGRETSVTNPDGTQLTREYDEHGREVSSTDPLGNTWLLERDQRGTITAQVDPEGRRLTRRWDAAYRWQELSNSLGHYRCEYDAKGRPVLTSDRLGLLRIFESDASNGVTAERTADGGRIAYEFNAAGNVVGGTYLDGTHWRFDYDRFGHMVGATDPLGGQLRVDWDREGRQAEIINQRGERHHEDRDARGDTIGRRYFDGRVERYERDAGRRVTAVHRPDGSVLRRKYDAADNLVEESVEYPASPGESAARSEVIATFEYDWMGHVVKATNSDATIEFVYDSGGHLIAERQNEFEIRYAYDRGGLLRERTLVGGQVGPIRFAHNDARILERISDQAGAVLRFSYDTAQQPVARAIRGGWTEELSYDVRRRVTGRRLTRGTATVEERRYEYDSADNVVAIHDSHRGTSRYDYDPILRLTSAASARKTPDVFQYEPGHNLTHHNGRRFIYEPGSRLRQAGDVSFDYDANGNVIARHEHGSTTRYVYDAKMRLRRVETPDGSRHEYDYDALGRRIAKRSPGREVRFVWAHRDLAAILPSDGPAVEVLVDPVRHTPSVQWVNGKAECFVGSHLGAPLALIRPETGIVWSATYEPFGGAEIEGEVTESATRYRLPGQYEDAETGLHYNLHRYYDPRIGRYLTPDPIGLAGSLNFYDYPRDPINWVDPLGLKCPNPKLVKSDPKSGIEIHEHDDGSLTITADCRKGFATPKPYGLRDSVQVGQENADAPPEAHLGKDGRLIVMEGSHRAAAASTGQQIPQDPDNPHLGGVPGKPGFMTFEYASGLDDDQEGVPLQSLSPPPNYPHKW
jgi:RHS repeat-associated protein